MLDKNKIIIAEYLIQRMVNKINHYANDLSNRSVQIREMEKQLSDDPLYCVISEGVHDDYINIEDVISDLIELRSLLNGDMR